ncbi:argininosuccinate lyase [Coccidioides posadasii str. Silveira]|uniref:argininosuccinate lyase n=1 Tax=Coccidioides posadasii (strain RMSCC 757 / Silveira) TaxID=443226 RepID=E9CWH9_COCPS|nr:argininosuccinate lyase [Coccidioides posadasii str. Silveira]QVM07110.1 argininosuccinate lyase [Coccidioides posadasii str. Silveira]
MASQPQSSSKPAAGKLWGGRFSGATDPLMVAYNESIYFDRAFYAQDIAGSIAFARANVATGILSQAEFEAIEKGLNQIRGEWENNTFVIQPGVDEDIHTANERRLGEIIGKDIAGKLHTGRSRNDQVATDLRLWLRDELKTIETYLVDLISTITDRAEADIEYLIPGYTHLQRGQPVRWSHWLLSYGTAFLNDLERFREVIKRVNRSPLGCGALSGNAFKIDREAMAKELGFEGLVMNSMAAVGDRDFILEAMQCGSTVMLHISRWSEDLILYSSTEFGFVRLSDAYTTGSSLMPQKKNSDSLELLRGKCGRLFGGMAGLMMTIKGIPSTYNKDLQESVEPMIEHVKTLKDSLQIANRVLLTMTTFPDKMIAALTPDMLATDLAEYLVRKGVPFRETHHIAGRVVALGEKENKPIDHLTLEQLKSVDQRIGDDVLEVFNYERSVEMKSAIGGTSKSAVLQQIQVMRQSLGN